MLTIHLNKLLPICSLSRLAKLSVSIVSLWGKHHSFGFLHDVFIAPIFPSAVLVRLLLAFRGASVWRACLILGGVGHVVDLRIAHFSEPVIAIGIGGGFHEGLEHVDDVLEFLAVTHLPAIVDLLDEGVLD